MKCLNRQDNLNHQKRCCTAMKKNSRIRKFRKAVSHLLGLLTKALFSIYCALLYKISSKRKILFNIVRENNFVMLAPIYHRLRSDPRLHIRFTSALCHKYHKHVRRQMGWLRWFRYRPDKKEPALHFLKPYNIDPLKILSYRQVQWRRWDVCIEADYKSPRIQLPTKSIQIFHGFSGKFTSNGQNEKIDGTINRAAAKYDRLFCFSRKHVELFVRSGFLKRKDVALRIGFPKIDGLVDDSISRDKVLRSYGADPEKMSVLYAPSWNPELSLNNIGEELIELLSLRPWTLLVKLHPISRQSIGKIKGYTRENWAQFLDLRAKKRGFIYVRDQNSSRYLKAADILITDHGSTLYEYMLLNRPVLYYDTPKAKSIMTMPETLSKIREAAHLFKEPQEALELLNTGNFAEAPGMADARRQLAQERFYGVGGATERAVKAIYQLIQLSPSVTKG